MVTFQKQFVAHLGGVLGGIPFRPPEHPDGIFTNAGDSARPRMLWIAHLASPGLRRRREADQGW